MKAMVLAAGLGTRLRPLTDRLPKALIEVGGLPMLEIVIRRLKRAGVDSVVVNVCHLADPIEKFLAAKGNFGLHVEISREDEPLDTGGGLKKASRFLAGKEPFFLHNVDVLSDVDLSALYALHRKEDSLATVAVKKWEGGRAVLFDDADRLVGWESGEGRCDWAGEPRARFQRMHFNGIHVISPRIFSKMTEDGAFSILKSYIRLAGLGEKVLAFKTDGSYWLDIGNPRNLETARADFLRLKSLHP